MINIRQTLIESIEFNYTRTQKVLNPCGYYDNNSHPFCILDKEKSLLGEIILRPKEDNNAVITLDSLPAPVLFDILKDELALQRNLLLEDSKPNDLVKWCNGAKWLLTEESKASKHSRLQCAILSIAELLRENTAPGAEIRLEYESNPSTPFPALIFTDQHQGETIEDIRTIDMITVDAILDNLVILDLHFLDTQAVYQAFIKNDDSGQPIIYTECPWAHFTADDIINLEEWLVRLLKPSRSDIGVRFMEFRKNFAEKDPQLFFYDRYSGAASLTVEADVPSTTLIYLSLFNDQGYFKANVHLEVAETNEAHQFVSMFRGNDSVHPDIINNPNFEAEYPDFLEEIFDKCEKSDFWPTQLHITVKPISK